MTHPRKFIAGVGALVAAVLAGCTHTPAATVSATPDAPVSRVWQDLSANPVPDTALPIGSDGWQYGYPLQPGMQIVQDGPTVISQCGVTLRATRGGRSGVLTAGHCDVSPGSPVYAVGDTAGTRIPVGEITVSPHGTTGDVAVSDDFAWVEFSGGVTPPAGGHDRIAGQWPLTSIMTTAEAHTLPAGTPVCVTAARAGVHCGTIDGVVADQIVFTLDSGATRTLDNGDSGGLVFAVDQAGNATAIAMLTTGLGPDMAAGPLLGHVLDALAATPIPALD